MDNKFIDLFTNVGRTLSKGLQIGSELNERVVYTPGNYYTPVEFKDLEKRVVNNLAGLDFSPNKVVNGELLKVVAMNNVNVSTGDVTNIIIELNALVEKLNKHYKSPTTVGATMERLADKAFNQHNDMTKEEKRSLGKYYTNVLRITKTITNHQMLNALTVVDKSCALIESCFITK